MFYLLFSAKVHEIFVTTKRMKWKTVFFTEERYNILSN